MAQSAEPAGPRQTAQDARTAGQLGAGTAADLRRRLTAVDAQVAAAELRQRTARAADPDWAPTPEEVSDLNKLRDQQLDLAKEIAAAAAKETPKVETLPTDQKYIIRIDPKTQQVIKDPATGQPPLNPNWDGKTEKVQTATIGNNVLVVNPDGTMQVAYTDEDAKALAGAQTKVSQLNAATAAASQKATQRAEEMRLELEGMKSRGEDSASKQAEHLIELRRLHEDWQRNDGDRRSAMDELRDYNTNRHQLAEESLDRDTLNQKREADAALNATTVRGQDLSAQAAAATVKANLANQRLQSGQAYMGNVLSTMAELNDTVAPGSDAVAQMLPGLLGVGEAFFSKLGGLDNSATAAAAAAAPPAATDTAKTLEKTGAENIKKLITGDTDFSQDLTGHRQLGIPEPTSAAVADFEERLRLQRQKLLEATAGGTQPLSGGFQQTAGPGFGAGFGGGIPDFSGYATYPRFQAGGVVPGAPTQEVPIIAHGGETVLPTGQPGMPPPGLLAAPPPPPAPPVPAGPPAVGPTSTIAQFLTILAQLLGGAGEMGNLAGQAAAATGLPPDAAANPTLPGSAVPGVTPQAAAAQARMHPLAPDGTPFAKPEDVARIFGRAAPPPGPVPASAPAGTLPIGAQPMPMGAMR